MRDKIKYMAGFLLMCVALIGYKNMVQGYTGTGTSTNPYVVTKESEIREILTTKGGTSWKYVAVNGDITLKNCIIISKGKFRIYAKGQERIIKRSGETDDLINSRGNPKFCMHIGGTANVVFGYKDGSNQKLRLGGNKAKFTGNRKSSGYLYIEENAAVTIDNNALLTNVKNNKSDEGSTAIFSLGILTINGEVSNCDGADGGAIGSKNGSIVINSTANIHHCTSQTEGGGIFCISNCYVEMQGGIISNCTAKEEGGGLFVGGKSQCIISAGQIKYNTSALTGGGVFSGNGAMLTVGKTDGTGPVIAFNKAGTVGGGIRCNGGLQSERGGTSVFYGGYVSNNTADGSVGGISCGAKGEVYNSLIYMRNMHIINNTAKLEIGGVRIPASAIGTAGKEVYITNCDITGNNTNGKCAGLMSECSVVVTNTNFIGNYNNGNGGAIYINGGALQVNSARIEKNTSDGCGDGVYVAGEFKIKDGAYVNDDNEVYLTKGRYIDVIAKLTKSSGIIAKINSEVNENGTKLVKVSYNGGSPSEELYHSESKLTERYKCVSIKDSQVLRPSENVNGYENIWIIISENYLVYYNKNTTDDVENMPRTQLKHWNENLVLSSNVIQRSGYVLVKKKYWNDQADGNGNVYVPGSVYTENKNITLYGIWKKRPIKEIYINTTNRYYVVNQNITLNKKELFKKVTTDDDLHTGKKYEIRAVKIDTMNLQNIAKGKDILTQKYLNTSAVGKYIITIEAMDSATAVKATAKMYVYVLNTDLSNGQVRFISYDYLNTLDSMSKWSKKYKSELTDSLSNEGDGIYDIDISNEEIGQIKNIVKNNNYKINNQTNKNIVGKLGI